MHVFNFIREKSKLYSLFAVISMPSIIFKRAPQMVQYYLSMQEMQV